METMNKPEMKVLAKGESFKTMRVNAKAGMQMPDHHATSEAVIVVEQGKAILKMEGEDIVLEKGKSILLPSGKDHSLKIDEDFQAVVIMDANAEIKFN